MKEAPFGFLSARGASGFRRGRRLGVLTAARLLTLVLVACGGSGAGGASGSMGETLPVTGDPIAIGEWTDAPGTCPTGYARVDIGSVGDMQLASRGEGSFAGDPSGVCYFIRNGTYRQQGRTLPLYVLRGGTESRPRVFVGESRDGVVIVGRATVEDGVSHVVLKNLTLSLVGYTQSGSYNTLTIGDGSDIAIESITLTGDCATGYRGGHIEANGTRGLRIEACLVEKFGSCSGDGKLDHGIYLASGQGIVVRNNVIRQNSSRGIQLYTAAGEFGTLADVVIERNRIYDNGHRDSEDGIVINGADSGTISRVTIERNLIYRNYFSGIRFSGPATRDISVVRNTFYQNGAASRSSSRSEINVDDPGQAAGSLVTRNVFEVGHSLINDCYDSQALGFALQDNFVNGAVPSGAAANCVAGTRTGNPQFYDAEKGDFRTRNPEAAAYGAYAR